MSAAARPLPLIPHPYSPQRIGIRYVCQWCGRQFYPWRVSHRKYCTSKCSGQAHHAAAEARHPSPPLERNPEKAAQIEGEMLKALAALRTGVEAKPW